MSRVAYKVSWNDEWLIEHVNDYKCITDLCAAYKNQFNYDGTIQGIRTHLLRSGIKSSITFSPEQEKFITDNYPQLGGEQTTALFNATFNTNRSLRSIMGKARNLGVRVSDTTVEANRKFVRRVPVGTIRPDNNGFLRIKLGCDKCNSSSGWVPYQRYIYEQNYGPVPKGYKVIFLDNNNKNFDPSNLMAVPASYCALMAKLKLKSNFSDVSKAGVLWCDLYTALKKDGWVLKRGKFIKQKYSDIEDI